MNLNAIERGAGSGFIWNDEGHIVTNLHVIVDADAIQVTTQDQKTYRATSSVQPRRWTSPSLR